MNRLYHFPLSPFSRKVRLVLAEKRVETELVVERYWERGADLMRRNPAGRVPVLRIGALTLSESQAICEYLEETHPDPALMPQSPEERAEVRRLCGWFDTGFHHEGFSAERALHTTGSKTLSQRLTGVPHRGFCAEPASPPKN